MQTHTDIQQPERGWLIHPDTGRSLTFEFMVDGWTYATETDDEKDNRKLVHYLVCDEACLCVDWTPYYRMMPAEVHAWLVLGCPERQGIRPLNTADLLHKAVREVERLRETSGESRECA